MSTPNLYPPERALNINNFVSVNDDGITLRQRRSNGDVYIHLDVNAIVELRQYLALIEKPVLGFLTRKPIEKHSVICQHPETRVRVTGLGPHCIEIYERHYSK